MNKTIPVDMNGLGTLLLPEHRKQQWEQPWEKERLDSLHANIKPGDVVYYIGAEEGDIPALIASWGAKMVLVEPSAKYWPAIKQTWEASELDPPFATFGGFAANEWSETGEVFYGGFPPAANGDIVPFAGFSNLCERPDIWRTKLDLFAYTRMNVPTAAPDIIAMDVEGAELEVLKGAEQILQHDRPLLYVSVHPQFMQDMYDQTEDQVYDLMESFGYDKTLLADVHERHFVFYPKDGLNSRRFIET